MNKVLWAGAALLVVAGFIVGVLTATCDPALAEPSGIELDIDRAKPRPPLKAPTAPKVKR